MRSPHTGAAAKKHVAVSMGSPRFRNVEAGSFRITRAWFPPHVELASHVHDRGILAMMLAGSFETTIASRRLDCLSGSAWTEPIEERHANRAGSHGAHVVVLQADPTSPQLEGFNASLLGEIHQFYDPGLIADGRRIAAEIDRDDDLTPFAIESLAMGLLVGATRVAREDKAPRPVWFERIREYLNDNVSRTPALSELSAIAGMPPSSLCRAFRAQAGQTIGRYVRSLRLERAMDRLVHTTDSISTIALASGYCDQAHFTRACQAATGMPPARYRLTHSR